VLDQMALSLHVAKLPQINICFSGIEKNVTKQQNYDIYKLHSLYKALFCHQTK